MHAGQFLQSQQCNISNHVPKMDDWTDIRRTHTVSEIGELVHELAYEWDGDRRGRGVH